MIRAAALSVTLALGAGDAVAEGLYEVPRYDLTASVSSLFEPNAFRPDIADGRTFSSADGKAEIMLYGANAPTGGIDGARDTTRENLAREGHEVVTEFGDDAAYLFSGVLTNGQVYFLYSRLGKTCEGEAVIGSFTFLFDPESESTYRPMVDHMIEDLHIGACG